MVGILPGDLVLVVVVLALVAGAVLLVRRRMESVLTRDAASVAAVSAAVIAVYGLILGLTLAAAWERYQRADETLTTELNEMFIIFRMADNWTGGGGQELKQAVLDYGLAVSRDELQGLSADKMDGSAARAAMRAMYQQMIEITAGPEGGSNATQPTWGALVNLDAARGTRLTLTRVSLPAQFWTVLYFGGAISLLALVVIHPENKRLHISFSVIAAALIILSLVLLRELDAPLSGASTIDFDTFNRGVAVLQEDMGGVP
jgi:hypothetical protein